jgi:hypothetical protein
MDIIVCKTKEEYVKLLDHLESKDIKWQDGERAKRHTSYWEERSNEKGIYVEVIENKITASDPQWYNNSEPILTACEEYIKNN